MAGEREYMRIPPDSSGKRVALEHTAQLSYDSKLAGYIWTPDAFYATSDGIRIFLYDVYESTATTGIINVRYSRDDEYSNAAPAIGTGIINLTDNAVVANVVSVKDVWYNSGNIVGASNPSNGLEVDSTGSSNIRFSEGRPQLDSFGKLRTSAGTLLGEYVFNTNLTLQQFATTELLGGTVTFDTDNRAVVLGIGSQAGAESRITTNCYHHYVPGSSHLAMLTLSASNPTVTGGKRYWGLFDERNGYAFTLNEQGQFGVTIRSSTSGSIVETFIPQDEFNTDRVNGAKDIDNLSGMNLDLTKDNLYWLDVQWLGAGRARFGVFYQGQRVTLHEYYHGNNFTTAQTQTASLPICITAENVSAATPLQLKHWCSSVWTEATVDIKQLGVNTAYSADPKTVTAGPADAPQPILAFSPQLEINPGETNHRLYMLNSFSLVAIDSTSGEQVPIDYRVSAEGVVTDYNWVTYPTSTMQFSESITAFDQGRIGFSKMIYGSTDVDVSEVLNSIQYGSIRNYADNGGTRQNDVTNITQASPAVVTVAGRLALRQNDSTVMFSDVGGMTQVNGNNYYIKPTSVNTAQLYLDAALTQPLDSTLFTAYTSGGTLKGNYGTRQNWVISVRNLRPNTTSTVALTLSWKEIVQ